jgi:hypothetical protein
VVCPIPALSTLARLAAWSNAFKYSCTSKQNPLTCRILCTGCKQNIAIAIACPPVHGSDILNNCLSEKSEMTKDFETIIMRMEGIYLRNLERVHLKFGKVQFIQSRNF